MIVYAPAQIISAPAQLITAPAQLPATGVVVYTAWEDLHFKEKYKQWRQRKAQQFTRLILKDPLGRQCLIQITDKRAVKMLKTIK